MYIIYKPIYCLRFYTMKFKLKQLKLKYCLISATNKRVDLFQVILLYFTFLKWSCLFIFEIIDITEHSCII